MTIVDLLSQLREAGIQLTLDGDKLKIKAPQGALTDALKEQLKQHKEAIIAFLQGATQERVSTVFPRLDRQSVLPLSYNQKGLWYFEQLTPGTAAYTMPIAFKLFGSLNPQALRDAVAAVVQRQEILRSRFIADENGEPHVVIDADPALPFEAFTLVVNDAEEGEALVRERVSQQALSTFDLTRGPLFRLQCITIHDRHGHILFSLLTGAMHHMISDGWSMNLFVKEIFVSYLQKAAGIPVPLPELDVQYVDYAAWQQTYLKTETFAKRLSYWESHLKGIPSHLALPTDFPRPFIQGNRGGKVEFHMNPALSAAFTEFCKRQDVTVFMGLMAAWKFVLSKVAGQEDFCLGIPMAGRNHKALESLIGLFIEPLIVRSPLSLNMRLLDNLQAVKKAVLDAFEHQDVPLAQIVNKLDVPRNPAYSPVAQIGFHLQNFSGVIADADLDKALLGKIEALSQLRIERVGINDVVSKYDMIVSLTQAGEALSGYIDFNADIFTEATISQLITHFETAMDCLMHQGDLTLRELPLIKPGMLRAALALGDAEAVRPLTDTQMLLYTDALMNPDTVQNSIGFTLDIPFAVDGQKLRTAIGHLIDSYSLLRTRFVPCELPGAEKVYQVVMPTVPLPLLEEEASALNEHELDARLQAWVYTPYDIHHSELYGFRLSKTGETSCRLSFKAHHILIDGTSIIYLIGKLGLCYDALMAGQPLPQWEDQYEVFIQSRRAQVDQHETLQFWRNRFQHCTPLSVSRVPEARPTVDFEVIDYLLDPEHTQKIQAFCKKNRTHPVEYFRLLTALMIRHYCRPEGHFVFNELQNGRINPKDDTIGVFYQALPWVIDPDLLQPTASLRECYEIFSAYRKEVRPHRQYSILAQLHAIDSPSIFFQFNYFNFLAEHVWQGQPVRTHLHSARVEKTVQCFFKELPDTLLMQLWCDRTVFDDHRYLERVAWLSRQLIEHDVQTLGELQYVLPDEVPTLNALTEVYAELPSCHSIMDLFEKNVEKHRHAVAVMHGDHRLTYDELNTRANRLARALQDQGVGNGSRVAILLGRRVEMLVAVLAVMKARASYVPVEASYPCERIQYIIRDSGARAIITEDCQLDKLGETSAWIFDVDADAPSLARYTADNLHQKPLPDDEIYVIYTSGSTGQPKGASVHHLGEVNLQHWYIQTLQLSNNDRTLIVSAFGFDLTQKNLYALLLVGGTVVLPEMDAYDDAIIRETIHQHGITLINCAPSAFYPLVASADHFPQVNSLRWVVLGGEPIRLPLLFPWLGSANCIARLVNSYGPTECTDVVAYHIIDTLDNDQTLIPIGLPVANCKLHILDHALTPVAPGLIGELCVSGICVGNGYVGRPDLTAQVFVDHPFGQGKLYKTGDLCRQLPSGAIEYIGRKDFQVKVRGLRIELGEIEKALTTHAAVKDALVLVRDEQLLAYVVAPDTVDATHLREQLRAHLPDYMVPSVILRLEAWPLTPNGKVDRKALPLPQQARAGADRVAPRNDTEHRLVQIWEEVLKRDHIGVFDNFFELGGHSLLATQIVSRTRKAFDIALSLRELLSDPTIAALAEKVHKATSGAQPLTDIGHADRTQRIPLSFAQQRLWLLDRIEPGNTAYNVPIAVRLSGALHTGALQQAVSDVINRHEGLRTIFSEDEQGPVQHFLPVQRWVTEERVLPASTADQAFDIQRFVAQRVAHAFDLTTGPLFQSTLLKVAEQEWIYVFVAHHIVTDGWSMGVFIREVLTAYVAYTRSLPTPLQPVTLQYADFSLWQRNTLDGAALAQKLAFWKTRLADLPVLALPTDFPRPPVQTYQGATQRFALSERLTTRIDALARAENTTPFAVLMALYAALMARYSNQTDFAIGTPVAGRDREALENVIGFFVNTVTLRMQVEGLYSLRSLMGQVTQTASEAFEHQDLPFENIVDAVDPARDMSRSPLFQVMMVLQNIPLDTSMMEAVAQHITDVSISPVSSPVDTAKFDLTLTWAVDAGRYHGALQFNTDLFSASTIERMIGHLQRLAECWVTDPDQAFRDLDVLSPEERTSLLSQWHKPHRDFDRTTTVQRLFAQTAAVHAERLAVRCGMESLSYRDLDLCSTQVAAALMAAGVKPGDRVGVCFDRSLHLMTALLGVLKCGATYVPIDASYPAGRVAYMLERASISHVLTRAHLRVHLPATACVHDVDAWLAQDMSTEAVQTHPGAPEDLFYIIFTSGSTGNPKGAAVFQRAEVNLLQWYCDEFGMGPEDCVLLMSAIGFDLTQKNLWAPLLRGACLEIPDFQEYDAVAFAECIRQRGVTWINCAPSAFYPLVDDAIVQTGYPTLRWVFLGGEPIHFARLAPWYRHTLTHLVNSYGPTECTDIAAYHLIPHDHPTHLRVPIGRPNDNVQLYVLGAHQELLPPGVTGELYIGGEGVGAGYIGDPEQTARVFVAHPLASANGLRGDRLYRTGDLVRYLPNGDIDYLGRIDHQIKLRGYRIEIDEIQAVINRVPGVVASHVAVQGEGVSALLAAWVVKQPEQNDAALQEAIASAVSHHLPLFMRPQACVIMDRFPLTPNGKIDRKALPTATTADAETLIPPTSPLQRELASLWCQALGVETLGLNSHFFNLGGNSLIATQIIARLNKRYNARVSVRNLFDHPRFEDFCRSVETAEKGAALPAIRVQRELGEHPLSYGQSRLWYFEQLNPGTCINNIPGALLIRGDFNPAGVQFAVAETLTRHAILRATFHLDGENGPVVRVHAQSSAHVEVLDARLLVSSEDEAIAAYIDTALAHETRTPFDLPSGPLLRMRVFRLPDQVKPTGDTRCQHALVFCMHHIVSDGVSMQLMLRELMTHYASYVTRKPWVLPSLKVQYTDYAHWQRDWLQGDALQVQLQYWEHALAQAPDMNTFPTDRERPAVQTTRGDVLQLALQPSLVEGLEQFARERNTTPFVVTLAAWKMLLCRYNQREDIAIGIPTSGRSHPDLEGLIGFFVNSLIIRTRWPHNATLGDVVAAVREATLGAFAHSNVPLDMIMQRLPIKRSTSHTPIVQVAFQLFSEGDNAPLAALSSFANLDIEPFQARRSTANFDVTLNLQHTPGVIKAALEYNTDLFDSATLETLWAQYQVLLETLVSDPGMPLQALQLNPRDRLLASLVADVTPYVDVIPLTHMQRDMFLDNMVNPGSLQSSHGWIMHVTQPVDVAIWNQAVQAYFTHYPLARSRYVAASDPALDVGYLLVPRETHIPVDFVDLGFVDHSGKLHDKAAVEAYLADFIYRPYDLTQDALVRFRIVKASDNHYAISVSAHHALFDGVALTSLWQQLAACYNALRAGQTFVFAEDVYLQHVNEDRATQDTADVLSFWTHTLATVEPLDFTVPPPVPVAAKARLLERFVSEEHWTEIRAYCRRHKITPALYFKGLYALMIDVYCRPDSDFSLQETLSGRPPSHALQPGCYIQEVPFVVPKAVLTPDATIDTLWQYAREFQKKIRDYRRLSLGAQARLSPRGRIGFMYNFYQFVPQTLELAGEPIEDPQGTPSDPAHNVQFVVSFVGGKLRLSLCYHPHLFDDRDLLARIEALSRQIIEQQVERLGDLRWVTGADELHRLLRQWNDTETAFALDVPIHVRFQQQAAVCPTTLAIVYDHRQLTYAELDRASNQLAHHLIACGITHGDLVGLCVERSCEFLIGILGILKAGGAYVPMDAHYPQERITYMRENSQAKVIVSQQALREKIGESATFRTVLLDADWAQIATQPETTPNVSVQPRDVAYMLYTSGSTGLPKGALIRHDGALNHIEAERQVLAFPGGFNFLQTAPASSDISVWQFLGPVTCGGTVVVLDDVTQADKLFRLVNQYAVNLVELVPVAWQLLIEHVKSLPEAARAMPSLQWLMATGEAVPVPMVNEWLALFPQIPVVNAYGPTEAADDVIQNTITQPLSLDVRSVPIGKPLPNMNVFIVDGSMRLVPAGIPGEICLSGIGVGKGYWQNPEKTAAAFVPNPFAGSLGDTIYKTGDLGRWLDDGTVEYLDRVDNQVKIRGFRIELGEVESVLAAQPSVAESAVIVRKDMPGGPALVGYVVPHEGMTIHALSVRAGMRERLPEYMVPTDIVVLAAFPTTPAGKIDKKNLPVPQAQEDLHFIAPANELETRLAAAYASVLGRDRVSVDREFFDLGGNSLMAVRLVSRLAQQHGLQLSVAQLLRTSSVRALAQSLSRGMPPVQGPLIQLREGSVAPDAAMQGPVRQAAVLFVHPVGGDVLCYQDLRACWNDQQPLYGLRSPGLDDDTAPLSGLSNLLAHYQQAIEQTGVQDWLLVGQSLGGTLALALAEHLQQRGHRVHGLVMLDSFHPASMKTRPDHLLLDALGLHLPEAFVATLDFTTDGWIDQVYHAARALNVVPDDLSLVRVKRVHAVARANEEAARQVEVPDKTSYPILHVAARDNSERSPQGWQDASLAMVYRDHAGHHETLMQGENARTLAGVIHDFLQQVIKQ